MVHQPDPADADLFRLGGDLGESLSDRFSSTWPGEARDGEVDTDRPIGTVSGSDADERAGTDERRRNNPNISSSFGSFGLDVDDVGEPLFS